MKHLTHLITVFALISLLMVSCQSEKPQEPLTWESLKKEEKTPEWFKDAKLGIYFHWGVYSVPAYANEWYPHWMYYGHPDHQLAKRVYDYHVENYGPLGTFDYHDFVPLFKAENFDAGEWADLFQKTGARFSGPVAQHHDGFAMWDSEVNPWNVADKGPRRDITGLLYDELDKRGIKTIATFHHAKLRQRYKDDPEHWAGKSADFFYDSHFPYHPDLVTSTTDPELRYLYGNLEMDEFHDYWLNQIKEVVDNYSPDIIWFDSWLDEIPEDYRQRMVAHQFEAGTKNNKETMVAYKQEDLPSDIGTLDIEQGGKTEISEDYWLTDITISDGSWCYTHDLKYKEADLIIRNMIDVWSKKGIVLLNVSPRADGIIPEEQVEILNVLGDWISRHEEAVYATRTYTMFGYGNAEIVDGHFGGQAATIEYDSSDFRFTVPVTGDGLYIYSLGLPEANASLKVENTFQTFNPEDIERVYVVGSNAEVSWDVDGEILILQTPDESEMNPIATVFRVVVN